MCFLSHFWLILLIFLAAIANDFLCLLGLLMGCVCEGHHQQVYGWIVDLRGINNFPVLLVAIE